MRPKRTRLSYSSALATSFPLTNECSTQSLLATARHDAHRSCFAQAGYFKDAQPLDHVHGIPGCVTKPTIRERTVPHIPFNSSCSSKLSRIILHPARAGEVRCVNASEEVLRLAIRIEEQNHISKHRASSPSHSPVSLLQINVRHAVVGENQSRVRKTREPSGND
jgi:hypothetical protein